MTTRKTRKFSLLAAVLTAILLTCEPVPDFCGKGIEYNPECDFCYGSKAYRMCVNEKGTTYNPLVQGCVPVAEVIGTRCSDESVVPKNTPCGGYTLTLAAAPSEAGTVENHSPPEGPTYAAGERVVLSARANAEYTFAGWAGALPTGDALGAVYEMGDSRQQITIVAMFKSAVRGKLITDAFPNAGGEVRRYPDKNIYDAGENVTLKAAPKPGYAFAGWSGVSGADASKDSVTVRMDSSETVVAMFTPAVHTLRVSANPANGGAVFINGTAFTANASQNAPTDIVILAREAEGFRFKEWTTEPPRSVTFDNPNNISTTAALSENAVIIANFEQGSGSGAVTQAVICTLTVNTNSGGGNVTLSPDGKIYGVGTRVTATAAPDPGFSFSRWSAGASTSDGSVATVFMNENKTLTAYFVTSGTTPTPDKYAVTVASAGAGASGGGSYEVGTTVTIKAGTAPTGQQFKEWTATGVTLTSPNSANTTFSMPENAVTVTAVFETQTPPVTPGGNVSVTVGGYAFEMVPVAGGTFTMGCTGEQGSDCYDDEKPAHSVTLSGYYIGKYEVTQGLWRAVMGSLPSSLTSSSSYGYGDNYPIYWVSWNTIVNEFIPALNRLTGKTYRLPTEAEWEYAARGGNKSGGYKYSGSNTLGSVGWYWDNIPSQSSGNSGYGTQPVGGKNPNELGIYDMSGNVWEWVSDWYSSGYSSGAQTNPTGPISGSYRVNRGGSWGNGARGCRVSNRYIGHPDSSYNHIGFRLVLLSP